MQIDILALNFSLTNALRNHAERRLRFALTRYNYHIQRIVMQLSDINDPRGSAGKHCHLRVVLDGFSEVEVRDIEADLHVAIDRATDRAERIVVRKIDLQQTILKQGHPFVLGAQ